MHYRRLGKSGLKVSEISLGSWVTFGGQLDEKTAGELIHCAYDAGVNFFDNADMYADGQAETMMGQAIKADEHLDENHPSVQPFLDWVNRTLIEDTPP